MSRKIVAVVGSYRKGKVTDIIVSKMLEGAESAGARTETIHIVDRHIEFCTNCRACCQTPPDEPRGVCEIEDDMKSILDEIESADALILACPVNFGTVTAVMKRFVERLVCYAYWPWGRFAAPKTRIKKRTRKAIIATSSAAPAIMGRLMMPNALTVMKNAAKCMGFKTATSLYVGLVECEKQPKVSSKMLKRAYNAGVKLAS